MRTPKALLVPFALAAAVAFAALPTVDGEVRKVEPAKGKVVIKHGDIPNLNMPPMTMEYSAAPKLLANVKPGDKVKFQADMVGSKATVVDLHVVK
ncbi:MAG TPA: copper-binding protein [Ramlibacter sp.]|jgi:Cu(I)/Ag(I) efflux system membrane protein CusA/SilA